MAQFTVNPRRFDPYKQFKFRVKWDGKHIAGIASVSALVRKTWVVEHREGSDPSISRRSPGQTAYEPITITRGRTHDNEFEQWANQVWHLGSAPDEEVSLKDFRKEVVIELLNEAGQLVMAFVVHRCWPSEYVALGPLDAHSSNVLSEVLILQHEGWERDRSIVEPVEPSF